MKERGTGQIKELEPGLEAVLYTRALHTRPFNSIFNNVLG